LYFVHNSPELDKHFGQISSSYAHIWVTA